MADVLRDNEIELHLEPGRAAVDQAGLTLARVVSVAVRDGDQHVVLEMDRSNLSSGERDFLVDPQLLPASHNLDQAAPVPTAPVPLQSAPFAAYLLGNLCLPDDLISRRLVPFSRAPRPGDLLAFPNSAGYFMDFTESETLLQRTAAKVVVDRRAGRWTWFRDEAFDPLSLMSVGE